MAVSLFQGVADAQVLSAFSQSPQVPHRFRGCATADWAAVLGQAAGVGLLTPLGGVMYRIHPALPAYLAQQWRREEPDDHYQQRAAANAALLDAYAALGEWLNQQIQTGDAAFACEVLDRQRHTLGTLLGNALDRGLWDHAQAIAEPLNQYWDARGLLEEAQGWVDRARLALETADGTPPTFDDPAGALWLLFTGLQANRELEAHHLDAAERTYLDICDMLQAQPESPQQLQYLAGSYHQLGWVAQARGRLDDAEHWYGQSLTINQRLGNRPDMARTYHHLGTVAQDRGRLNDAEHWYGQSLTIKEELGNRPGMATTYRQLGRAAQDRGRLDDAEHWYGQSLTINQQLGNRPGMATTYHNLGVVAQLRGRLDDAEHWYGQSLIIKEELGNRPGMAATYHQLGTVAQQRGRVDDAEDWYRQSLTINQQLGNRPDIAASFGQLGLLAETRGRVEEALEWLVRCVTLFDEFSHPITGTGPTHLARLTGELGIDTLERCWHRVTGQTLPLEVRDFIASGPTDAE